MIAEERQFHINCLPGDVGRYCLLPGDPGRCEKIAKYFDDPVHVMTNREYVTYTGSFHGKALSVMSCGFGCMPAAIAVEELNHLGVKAVVKLGLCPALQPETPAGTLLAASGAVRGEGATREYIDVSYPAVPDPALLGRLLDAGVGAGLFRSHDCTSLETPWSQEGKARIARWAALGVEAIDGETSALFVISSILKLRAASLALISENYATGERLADPGEGRRRLFAAAAEALQCF